MPDDEPDPFYKSVFAIALLLLFLYVLVPVIYLGYALCIGGHVEMSRSTAWGRIVALLYGYLLGHG